MKSKVLIFSLPNDYYRQMYSDVVNMHIAYYCPLIMRNNYSFILKILFRLYSSPKIFKYIRLPFRKYYYKKYVDSLDIPNEVFDFALFQMDVLSNHQILLVKEIKRRFPNIKCVLHFHDIIESRKGYLNLANLKYFSQVYHYDKDEAQKYGFTYEPTHMSYIYQDIDESFKSDIFYCGVAKDRHGLLLKIYQQLTTKGYKCVFILLNVPLNERIIDSGLIYIDVPIPYLTMLKYVQGTRCLLELVQQSASGATLRTWEAILYKKRLVTNNSSIINEEYYNSDQIVIIGAIEECDKWFRNLPVKNYIAKDVSPICFFRNIIKETIC